LRRLRNRIILGVCEDFEGKRNAKITLLDNFFYKKNGCVTKGAADQQSKNHILQKEYFLRI